MTDNLDEQVYQFVFALLDAEPEIDGMAAGQVATRTANAFAEFLTIQVKLK